MKTRRIRRQPDEVRFDFAPMVDVVMILLIFFFLASRLTPTQALPVELPEANTEQSSQNPLVVSLTKDGRLALNGQTLTLEQLEARLRQIFATRAQGVVLEADKAAQHGDVVNIMSLIRALGGTQLEIATLPEGSP